jgi:hypothetical protein
MTPVLPSQRQHSLVGAGSGEIKEFIIKREALI